MKAAKETRIKNLTYNDAANKYGIPKTTLRRKVNDKNRGKNNKHIINTKPGRPISLTEEDEENIVKGICLSSKWGFPFKSMDIRLLVQSFLNKKEGKENRFKNNLPGYDWFRHFFNRNKSILSERLTENIKRSKAKVNSECIKIYFDHLKNSLTGVSTHLIINYDEINMVDDPREVNIITRRRCKHPKRILNSSTSCVSVMFAGTPSGFLLPPYVVYKADNLNNDWTEGEPKGTMYNYSKSGWFDNVLFEDWFNELILPYFRKFPVDMPKAMIGDNFASHITIGVIEECKKYNIRFILLPSNSTRLCQPLHVAIFKPLKMQWRKSLSAYKNKNRDCIPKTVFPRVVKNSLKILNINNCVSKNLIWGFKSTGIFPLNENAVLSKLPILSKNLNESIIIEDTGLNTYERFLLDFSAKETSNIKKKQCNKISDEPRKSITSKIDLNDKDYIDIYQPSTSNSKCIPYTHSGCQASIKRPTVIEQCKISGLSKGNFVVANLLYNSNSSKEQMKKFYAKIIDINENSDPIKFKLKYLKQSVVSKDIYIFPVTEDIGYVTIDQISDIVYPDVLKRNRHKFPINIDS